MNYDLGTKNTVVIARIEAKDSNNIVSDSRIVLSGPTLLEFNRSNLRETDGDLSGTYLVLYNNDRVEYGEFRFRDLKGTMYINHLPMAYDIHLNYNSNFIPGDGSDLVLNWLGLPLGEYESVSVELKNIATGNPIVFYDHDSVSVTIPGDRLVDLPDGDYMMSISRLYNPPLIDSSSAGGSMSSTYTSVVQQVTL